jgi:hypothetical protein
MSVGACIDTIETALRPYVDSGALPGYVAVVSVAVQDRRRRACAMVAEGLESGPFRIGADQLDDHQRAIAQEFFGHAWSWGLGCQVKLTARARRVLLTHRGLTGPRPPDVFVAFWDAVYRGL